MDNIIDILEYPHKVYTEQEFKDNDFEIINDGCFYTIKRPQFEYNFFTHFKPGNDKLLIMGQAAVDRDKRQLPIFHTWSWAQELPYNVIVLSDSTLYLDDDIKIAWFQGNGQEYCLFHTIDYLRVFIDKLNITGNNTVLYGSSAGGFSALMMSAHLKHSLALVNNPQTDFLKYRYQFVKYFLETCTGNMSPDKYREKYPTRYYPLPSYRKLQYIPPIYYIQNTADSFHLENHFTPFVNELKQLSYELSIPMNHLSVKLYEDRERGHLPLGKEETIREIQNAFLLQSIIN